MKNKKMIGLTLLTIFCFIGFSGVPTAAQFDATPELSFPLWVLSWDDISVDTGTGLRLQMADIGIELIHTIMDDDPMYEGINPDGGFILYEMSHGYSPFPDHPYDRMHSDNIVYYGGNPYVLNNATVDALIEDYLSASPAELAEKARLVQVAAKHNIPYIPLFLSDDTHAIRSEWSNYTLKPGGIFTTFNPQTMIFMESSVDNSIFVMAYSSDIGEMNPLFWRSERSHWYNMLVYDTLLSFDNESNLIPWLAEDYAISADGTQINYTLRTGAQWHDGNPVTPEDVEFSINYYKNGPSDVNDWPTFQHITSTSIDGQTITVNMDQTMAFAPHIFGTQMYVLPKHVREGIAQDDARWDDPNNATAHIGSGPYNFTARVEDEWTLVDINNNWWGPANPYVGQLPNIQAVRIDVVIGQDARILAMRAGDADSERYEVFGAYVNVVLNAPELTLITGLASQWDYVLGFHLNVTEPGFPGLGISDFQVRKAMSHAINRPQLVNIGRLGHGRETHSIIPETFYASLYHADGDFWEYDVTVANEILDAAGYLDVDGDGVREYPGVAIPPPPPNLILIGIAGVVALVIGIVISYVIMRMRKG